MNKKRIFLAVIALVVIVAVSIFMYRRLPDPADVSTWVFVVHVVFSLSFVIALEQYLIVMLLGFDDRGNRRIKRSLIYALMATLITAITAPLAFLL